LFSFFYIFIKKSKTRIFILFGLEEQCIKIVIGVVWFILNLVLSRFGISI